MMKNNYKHTLIALTFAFGLCSFVNAQSTLYSEDFTGQDDKGKIGTASVDTSGVNWTLDVSNGTYPANSNYMAVGENTSGVFSVSNNKAQNADLDSWTSPSFSINGFNTLEFSFDAYADGDFEDVTDQFNVVFLIDSVEQTLLDSTVDESMTDDPMFFGSTDLSGTTLKSFTKSIAGTGTNGQIRIDLGNNAATETYAFDNLSVSGTAVPEPGHYAALLGLFSLGFIYWQRRRVH